MTHSKGTEAAISHNNRCVARTANKPRVCSLCSLKFPSTACLSNCTRALYIYTPPSLQLVVFMVQCVLYLVPHSTDGARQPAKAVMAQSKGERIGAERSCAPPPSLCHPASTKKKQQHKQSSQPSRGTGGDRLDTHWCTATNTHMQNRTEPGRDAHKRAQPKIL